MAQTWRFVYPGSTDEKSFDREAVASFFHQVKTGATALRLVIEIRLPGVAAAATQAGGHNRFAVRTLV